MGSIRGTEEALVEKLRELLPEANVMPAVGSWEDDPRPMRLPAVLVAFNEEVPDDDYSMLRQLTVSRVFSLIIIGLDYRMDGVNRWSIYDMIDTIRSHVCDLQVKGMVSCNYLGTSYLGATDRGIAYEMRYRIVEEA